MDKKLMPMARQDRPRTDLQCDLSPRALDRWLPNLMAAAADNTISIFDPIGVDFWTGEGVTAKRISAALRSIGDNDVIVNINSPGGDLFEGMTIYNLLREHKGSVTVKILGLAASAASIIAMAGDEIQIARAGFLMIHNTWVVVMGNRNDLRDVADQLDPFDDAMASIYAARTGIAVKAIQKKMDAETWINGDAAVEEGWADSLLPADEVKQDKNKGARAAGHLLDTALAKAGLPHSERRTLLQDYQAQAVSHTRAVAGAHNQKEQDMNAEVQKPAATQPATPEQLKAEYDRGFADGKAVATTEADAAGKVANAASAKAATERIKAIQSCASAKERPTLAAHLAFETAMSSEDAQALLEKAAPEAKATTGNPLAAAMPPNPKVGADVAEEDDLKGVVRKILSAGKARAAQ